MILVERTCEAELLSAPKGLFTWRVPRLTELNANFSYVSLENALKRLHDRQGSPPTRGTLSTCQGHPATRNSFLPCKRRVRAELSRLAEVK